ncbi:hypothetical protein [Flavobacterium sp.]|uniref:hypothetical protein n=1 Tax=Flavobacterium sp. TaxID=239 RepID=UPI003A929984
MKKILFIEDNKTKAEAIKKYLLDNANSIEIVIKESFTSGLRELFTNNYDLLLVDMSLPTREGMFSNTINNFEQLGGHKIMSEMKRKNKMIPTILITMFSEFGVGKNFMDIQELNTLLSSDFSNFYQGYVYYSSQEESWKNKLYNIIKEFI